jgi:hypothetical protein
MMTNQQQRGRSGRLKALAITGIAAAVAAAGWAAPAQAADSIEAKTVNVWSGVKMMLVQLVTVDLSDPHITVEPVVAEGGVGTVQDFAEMMADNGAAAGINGAFFDAYEPDETRRFPNGLLLRGGEPIRSGDNPAFTVTADKTAFVARLKTQTEVKVTHGSSDYRFKPWGVNVYYGASSTDQVVLYTPDYGRSVDFPSGVKVVVSEGKIVEMTEGAASVPDEGYVVFVGTSANNRAHLLPHLHVGDRADIRTTIASFDGAAIDASRVLAAVGAGPKLVGGGKIDLNYARDGFDDPKIVSASGARSFIGLDGEGRLVLGTAANATVAELAQAAVGLGLVEAMNLDGGASSALFEGGNVITRPGRKLSNAFIVKLHDRPQVQIEVNGSFVGEFRGFIADDTTMAPFRGMFERLGAPFEWDGDERKLTVEHKGKQVVFRPDDATALVNGKPVRLPAAPRIVDGHMYIPLRFISETFGAKVSWNQELYRASVDM